MKEIKKILRERLDNENNDKKFNALKRGVEIVCEDLGVDIPEIEYINDPNYTKVNKSFAAYSPSEKKVYVVVHNRNGADIMRSLAHELLHYKQDLDGRLTDMAGEDGDEFENEANSYSGRIMRRIGREVENIFENPKDKALLNEDYDTHEELTKLSNELFKQVIIKSVNRLLDSDLLSRPKIFPQIFSGIETFKYSKLNEFIKSYHLNFKLQTIPISGGGEFESINKTNGIITLREKALGIYNGIKEVVSREVERNNNSLEFSNEGLKELYTDVYVSIYRSSIISVILHELTHAYHSWLSNEKYASDKYSNNYYKDNKNPNTDPETYKKYLKLHHEITARFEQAIAESKLIEMIWDEDDPRGPQGYQYAIPIKDFIKSFIINFVGYKELNPKQQKYVLRRASQYYHRAKEKYEGTNGLNNTLHEEVKLLNEDFDVTEEIEILSKEILMYVIDYTYELSKRRVSENSSPKLAVNYINVFNNIRTNKIVKLKDFIEDFILMLLLSPSNKPGNKGSFTAISLSSGTIRFSDDFERLYEICNDDLEYFFTIKNPTEMDLNKLKIDLHNNFERRGFTSTMIHELTHAYEFWVSKNKYHSDKHSKKYYSDRSQKNSEEKFKKYTKLHHEITARFAQAINKTNFLEVIHKSTPNESGLFYKIRELRWFMGVFVNNFAFYENLTPKQQKYVLRRASQYYHKAKEKYDGKNLRDTIKS